MSGTFIQIPPSGSGVTKLNNLTGSVTLAAGSNITLTPAGNTITIASSGGGGASIGGAVSGGTDGAVLFINPAGILAQDPTLFYYDVMTPTLFIPETVISQTISSEAGGWGIYNDGHGILASGGISWDVPGNITIGGNTILLNIDGSASFSTSSLTINTTGDLTANTLSQVDAQVWLGLNSGTGVDRGVALNSIFIGNAAGSGATGAYSSYFIGWNAGMDAANANNAIFIGTNAGISDTVNNGSGSSSILIGNNTGTGGFIDSICIGTSTLNNANQSINLGGVLFARGIYNDQTTQSSDPVVDGRIGVGTNNPQSGFHALSTDSGIVLAIFEAITDQSQDLVQFKNESGTVVSGVKNSGALFGSAGYLTNIQSSSLVGVVPLALGGNGYITSAFVTSQTSATQFFGVTSPGGTSILQIGVFLTITAISGDVIEIRVTYTDETGSPRTKAFYEQGSTTAGKSATGAYNFPPMILRVQGATSVQVETVLTTGTGSITYDAGATLNQLQ